MTPADIHQRLCNRFAGLPPLAPPNKDPFVVVPREQIAEICRFLKTDPDLAFDCLMNLSAVDWPKRNQIEVVYHLWSYQKRHAFILKVQLDRAEPRIDSVEPVWKAADWLEREQYDLLGVTFTGHPDLRRIMLPDDWVGFPLRKDYAEQPAWHNIATTRENSLEGYVRLDELRKKASEAAAAAPDKAAPPAKKEVLQ